MDETAPAVEAANATFYTALSLADFGLMERLWLPSPDVVCIHPGWPPLHVWPSEVHLRLYGQTAEVSCLENIDMNQVRRAGVLQTRATNIFRLAGDEWKMLEHHALPMPGGGARPLEPFSTN